MQAPWPYMMRTIYGDKERFESAYFGLSYVSDRNAAPRWPTSQPQTFKLVNEVFFRRESARATAPSSLMSVPGRFRLCRFVLYGTFRSPTYKTGASSALPMAAAPLHVIGLRSNCRFLKTLLLWQMGWSAR